MKRMIVFKLDKLIKKKKLAETNGISNRELARRIGVSHVALFKMRNAKPYNPSFEMIDRLCSFFECKIEDVLEYQKK